MPNSLLPYCCSTHGWHGDPMRPRPGNRSGYCLPMADMRLKTFVNKVAWEVAKTHPNGRLTTLAYADYAYYPRNTKLEPNVAVQLCLHSHNWWAPWAKEIC